MLGTGIGVALRRISPSAYRALDASVRYLSPRDKAARPRGRSGEEAPPPPTSIQASCGPSQSAAEELPGDREILGRAEKILTRAIELGRKGRLRIIPEHISISATENCNLKCVMCPGHAGMTGPRLSLTEANELFASLADAPKAFGHPKMLDMTSGEPTLNQELHSIYRRFKELFPDAGISIISNATLPVRGRIREAFELADIIGLSMDGATEETYERIRQGSKYANVVRNVRDIAAMKKVGVNCRALTLMFVAMNQNIHELPAMVRLAHECGIPILFAQVSEIRSWMPFRGNHDVSLTMGREEIAKYVAEARREAARLGIQLELTAELDQADKVREADSSEMPSAGSRASEEAKLLEIGIKTCHVPWINAPRISQNHEGIYPTTVCCHMPQDLLSGNLQQRPEFRDAQLLDIYNSSFYWDIRAGLLDGSLAHDACKGCQYYRMTQWTPDQLRELERVTDELEMESTAPPFEEAR